MDISNNPVSVTSSANNIPSKETEKGKERSSTSKTASPISTAPKQLPPKKAALEGKAGLKIEEIKLSDKDMYERLHNPDLSIADQILLRLYIAAKDKSAIKKIIKNKLITAYTENLAKYSGRENMEVMDKEVTALQYAVDALKIFSINEGRGITIEAYRGILPPTEQSLIDNFRKHPSEKSYEAILQKVREYSYYWQGSIWGTKARADLYRNMTAFMELAKASGIDPIDIMYAETLDTDLYPKGNKYLDYLSASVAASTPEKSDDQEFKHKMIAELKGSIDELYKYFNGKNLNIHTIDRLLVAYQLYESILLRLGVKGSEILKIENDAKSNIAVKPAASKGPTQIVTPDGLPPHIVEMLKRTDIRPGYSYYQFLKENVQYIIFSKEKENVGSNIARFGEDSAGGYIADGIIHIDISKPSSDGPRLNEIYLFRSILHEAHHAYNHRIWFGENKPSIPGLNDEGTSYGFDAEAMRKASVNLPQDIRAKVNDAADSDEVMLKASMMIYDMKDLLEIAFDEKDMQVYPTNTPYFKAYVYVSALKKSGTIKPDQERYFVRVLSDVIMDNVDLENAPNSLRNLIKTLLGNIDPAYETADYKKAYASFKRRLADIYPGEKFYGMDMIQYLYAYSASYKVAPDVRGKLEIFDYKGKSLGIIPSNTKIKLLLEKYEPMNKQGFYKVSYGDTKGYVKLAHLVDYMSD